MNPFTVNYTLEEMLSMAVAVVVFASIILAILYSLWGGFLLITSGGTEEKVKPAVNHIRHALIGLVVLIIILFSVPKVLDLFGMPYGKALAPRTIFQNIREVSAKLFGANTNQSTLLDTNEPIDSLPSDFSDL